MTTIPQSSIERCPDDILCGIEEGLQSIYAGRKSLLALRLTCRRLNDFFTRFVVKSVEMDWGASTGEEEEKTPRNRVLGVYSSKKGTYIPFSPTPGAFVSFISSLELEFELNSIKSFGTREEVISSFESLWTDIAGYKSLNKLSVVWMDGWDNYSTVDSYYQFLTEKLVQAIHQATGGKLSELSWRPHTTDRLDYVLSPSHPPIRELKTLVIKSENPFGTAPRTTQMKSMLGDLVLHNPGLRFITLKSDSRFPLCKAEELFPTHHESLGFEKIKIEGILPDIMMNENTAYMSRPTPFSRLPAMKHLQELTIHCDRSLPKSPPNLDFLWLSLKDCGARLTYLYINYGISESLMEYLASYEGLETCGLNLYVPPVQVSPASTSFAKSVLPKQAASLTYLSINSSARGYDPACESMALHPSTWPAPSSFIQLKDLCVLIPQSWEPDVQTFQRILDYAVETPKLQVLHVLWRNMDINEGEFDDHMKMMGDELSIKRCALQQIGVGVLEGEYGSLGWSIQFPPIGEGGQDRSFRLSSFMFWLDD
ncbi:hypothetical protein AX16_008237 [Volvariella volvacea WC 439]|nr:hypothetical protein AX16_008237 [Volvariella volvacea WC 439]